MSSAGGTTRNLTLDFVKGILVIVMVIYHTMNVFSTAGPEAYEYVRFVSGSFVFISGYIISAFYEKKFYADRIVTSKRLAVRGLKLIIVFTLLNILINLTGVGNPSKFQLGLQHYLSNFIAIYGLGDPRYASFQILLPISYLLVISPFFLLFSQFRKLLTLVSLAIAFASSFAGIESINFVFTLIGLIGLFVGMVVNRSERSFYINNRLVIFIVIFACVFIMGYMDRNLMTYSISVMVVTKLFYDLGRNTDLGNRIAQPIIIFGQYSLVCYIAQIIILQGLAGLLSRPKLDFGYEIIFVFLFTNLSLLVLCVFLTFLRFQYRLVDKTYKVIFS